MEAVENEIDVVEASQELVFLCEANMHANIVDACGEMIGFLEKLREQAIGNNRLKQESRRALKMISEYK